MKGHFFTLFLLHQEHLEELAILESLDNGKPLSVAKSSDLPEVANSPIFCEQQTAVSQHAWERYQEHICL